MDSSVREQGSDTQEAPKSFWLSLRTLASQLMRLVNLVILTEEEQEEAGIYRDRPGGD